MDAKNKVTVFNNAEFGEVRALTINGEPWFVGKDVAEALGYESPRAAVSKKVDAEDRGVSEMETPSGKQQMTIINESGLYSLIMSSKLPGAKQFKRWITSEVLPSIRKHGGYIMGQESMTSEEMLAAALLFAQKKIEDREARIAALTAENKVMAPKADYYDALVERDALTNFRDTAKELGIGEKVFIRYLLDKKYIYRDARRKLKPYAKAKTAGLFAIKDFCSGGHTGSQTLITTEGKNKFRMLIQQENFAKTS